MSSTAMNMPMLIATKPTQRRGLARRSAAAASDNGAVLLRVAHHVEDGDGLAEALQRDIADLFQPGDALGRGGDPLADQDLPVLCLGAQSGREVAHRADRSVADALGETDLPQSRIALRDAEAEADRAAAPAPLDLQFQERLAHL